MLWGGNDKGRYFIIQAYFSILWCCEHIKYQTIFRWFLTYFTYILCFSVKYFLTSPFLHRYMYIIYMYQYHMYVYLHVFMYVICIIYIFWFLEVWNVLFGILTVLNMIYCLLGVVFFNYKEPSVVLWTN